MTTKGFPLYAMHRDAHRARCLRAAATYQAALDAAEARTADEIAFLTKTVAHLQVEADNFPAFHPNEW